MPLEIEHPTSATSLSERLKTRRDLPSVEACFIAMILALLAPLLAGCSRPARSAPDPLLRSFGVHPNPSASLELHITRSGASLVEFKVVPATGGSSLLTDSIGSDAMRWFFWWESSDSLWAYGSDTGYFCHAVFPAGGRAVMTPVAKGSAIPREVRNGLPESKRARYIAGP